MFNAARTSEAARRRRWLLTAAALLAVPAFAGNAAPSRHSVSANKIIISGAAGHLGELTVKDLLARGVPASRLILVSRSPTKLARFAKMGASVRYGDFTKPSSLPAAFAGGKRMLLISIGFGEGMPRPEAHKNAIEAAIADGVKHIAYTSWVALSRGARTGLAADHYATEQILERSGVAWTMLRNSVYMEELLPEAETMATTARAVIPQHDYRIGYVARADCAAAAAAVLSTPGHDYKIYNITGATLVGTRKLAAAVSAVTGKHITVVAAARPSTAEADEASNRDDLSILSNDFEQLTGRAPMTLEAFLEEHRAQLLRSAR